jgi:transcriptional regulator with XRE-family HTH domain
MLVGAQLRRLREAAQVTREEAAETIRASDSKISRLELGRTGFKLRDVTDLLARYGVSDEAERATLLALAGHANTPGWSHAYSDVIPTGSSRISGWNRPPGSSAHTKSGSSPACCKPATTHAPSSRVASPVPLRHRWRTASACGCAARNACTRQILRTCGP